MGKEAQKQKRASTEREIEAPGKASWVLRYLGPLLHHTLNNSAERTARKEAMRKKFYSMGDFWRSKAPFTYKKAIFISKIAETGISGWTSFYLQNIDYETRQQEILRYARKILGKAAWKQIGTEQKIEYRPISNAEVLRKFRLCTIFTELRVRRIKWVQKMVKCAHRHIFENTALFGVSACDEQEPCDDKGRLRPTANPWAHQIAGDIQALSYSDNAVEFKKIYKGKLLNLWVRRGHKGTFF